MRQRGASGPSLAFFNAQHTRDAVSRFGARSPRSIMATAATIKASNVCHLLLCKVEFLCG
jgi:hypothetical protein